jgi:hypothetical protein
MAITSTIRPTERGIEVASNSSGDPQRDRWQDSFDVRRQYASGELSPPQQDQPRQEQRQGDPRWQSGFDMRQQNAQRETPTWQGAGQATRFADPPRRENPYAESSRSTSTLHVTNTNTSDSSGSTITPERYRQQQLREQRMSSMGGNGSKKRSSK